MSRFTTYLSELSENDWLEAVRELLPAIHEVDRNAVQIWFRFYPLALQRFITTSPDGDEARRGIAMQGDFGLAGRIDTSHDFLYGHRFWKSVKQAIIERLQNDATSSETLVGEIRNIAKRVSDGSGVDASLTTAIAAVGLMTLVQVGPEAFSVSVSDTPKPSGLLAKSPESIVNARKADDSQGILGFLKTVDKKFSVIHDEKENLKFAIVNDQEIASASANDRSQNWQARDSRCWEGPVPVECTSASCGTCWVGVVAGAEKLSKVERRERRAVKVFGYDSTESDQPLIRLACQAKASGNVTIVIPPWNAVFGKKVYGNVEELELEPVTTSAKTLREVTREATAGD
jgi:ferredoxin